MSTSSDTGETAAPPLLRKPVLLWLLVAILCAAAVTRFIPPFQSPDENVHLLRAAMIANGQLLLERGDGTTRDSGRVDVNFVAFADSLAYMTTESVGLVDPPARQRVDRVGDHRWAGRTDVVQAAGTGYYAPLIYLPHAIGLWLSEHMGLTLLQSYELTRALVVGSALAIAAYACVLMRPNVLVLMLLLTPMSIFQWFSPTIDGLCGALLLLLLATWARTLERTEDEPRTLDEALLYFCTFMLCTTRTNLLPILLVPLLLLVRHFSTRRLLVQLALVACVLGWVVFAASVSGDVRLARTHTNLEILLLYLGHPAELLDAFVRTLDDPERVGNYALGVTGLLGWLNAPISWSKVETFGWFFALGMIVNFTTFRSWRDSRLRVAAVMVALVSVLLIFLALAVTYNDYPTPHIVGVQGRYFILPLAILAFALGPIDIARRAWTWQEALILVLYVPFALNTTVKTLARNYAMEALAF